MATNLGPTEKKILSNLAALHERRQLKEAEVQRAEAAIQGAGPARDALAPLSADVDVQDALKYLERPNSRDAAVERLASAEAEAAPIFAAERAAKLALPILERELGEVELEIAVLDKHLHRETLRRLAVDFKTLREKEAAKRSEHNQAKSQFMGLYHLIEKFAPEAAIAVMNHINYRFDHRDLDHDQIRDFETALSEEMGALGIRVEKSPDREFDSAEGRQLLFAALGIEDPTPRYAAHEPMRTVEQKVVVTVGAEPPPPVDVHEEIAPHWDGPGMVVVDHGPVDWAPGRVVVAR